MANIVCLNQETINKIAAGEVVDRPSSIVKELLENAIDAKSTSITVEIKDGGTSFIRITDNGCGIDKEDIKIAFLRHTTSKIKTVEDLLQISTLGFRGEALSSIGAVSMVELITKTKSSLTGIRYVYEGGEEKSFEEIGVPDGTTFIVRNLFYNTPARRKFLKSASTEGAYISDIVERIALSNPHISIKFISNGQNKLHTSGNGKLKDVIYAVYGKDITSNLIEINEKNEFSAIEGFIGKPLISRGNRNYETYFINGRYIKSNIISKAIENGYGNFLMQHKYPFTVINLKLEPELLDVNVHPSKMEVRFRNQEEVYGFVLNSINDAVTRNDIIPKVSFSTEKEVKTHIEESRKKQQEELKKASIPEPFEVKRKELEKNKTVIEKESSCESVVREKSNNSHLIEEESNYATVNEQLTLFDDKLLSEKSKDRIDIVGQIFDTYWIVQFNDNMFIIDQHAAHEKVLYEKTMARISKGEAYSQMITPPIILSLSQREEDMLKKYMDEFTKMGYEIEHFGERDYAVRGIPAHLFSISKSELLMEIIDNLTEENMGNFSSNIIPEKIASMSCKAAVKGNNKLSYNEAKSLIEELMKLENPYNCPHGRPTIISMSKYELEKKFKRIV